MDPQHKELTLNNIDHPDNNKEIADLKNTINHMNLTNIYRTIYPTTTEYTYFLSTHRTFSKKGHILDHKISLANSRRFVTPVSSLTIMA